jgi:hypothetical protein
MAAEFKKGQRVNVYFGDFHTANVKVESYTVASCGAKQLHLICNDGSNAEFRCYAPFRRERMYSDVQCASVDPVAHTLALRKRFAGWTREHFADRTRTAEQGLQDGDMGAVGYAKAIAESKARFEAATADL